jgi:nucleoside 2-deoxyribosyltransferase
MESPPKVYVASPLGFTDAGRLYCSTVLLPAVRAAGFEPLDPWAVSPEIERVFALDRDDPERAQLLGDTNRLVGRRNAEMIRSAAGVLAILDGDDVDSGTAAEVGYAAALARPIVGLRTDMRTTGDNEATLVNLQVEWFIIDSGGRLTTTLDDALTALVAIVLPPPTRPSAMADPEPRSTEAPSALAQAAHDRAVGEGADGYADPETGLLVFTATYLSARGTCCDSDCRHCPYRK